MSVLDSLKSVLERCGSARVVFVDEPPPAVLLSVPRVSFVGCDDKVGILAAVALHEMLCNQSKRMYCAVSGPAAEGRVNRFRQAISLLDPEFDVELFRLADVDRIENLPHLNDSIKSCPTDTPIGISARNDETALGMLQAIYNAEMRNVFVVGCDCTREMRLAC